jgi:hypothetical protein
VVALLCRLLLLFDGVVVGFSSWVFLLITACYRSIFFATRFSALPHQATDFEAYCFAILGFLGHDMASLR